MKICILTPRCPPDIGGVSQATWRIGEQLQSHGHQVKWLVPSQTVASNDRVFRGPETNLSSALEAFGPQVIHGFYPSLTGGMGVRFKKRFHAPLVLSCRGNDLDRDIWDASRFQVLHESLTKADAVTGVTSDLCRKAMALGVAENRAFYVPNSVDAAHFQPGDSGMLKQRWNLPQETVLLGVLGEIRQKKGWPLILMAYQQLKQKYPQLRLALIGRIRAGSDQALFDTFLLKHPELRTSVFQLDYQTHERLPAIYQSLDWVLLPSYQEGMSNVLLEAMACGVKVIASHVGGFKDVIQNKAQGLLIPPYDLGALVATLELAVSGRVQPDSEQVRLRVLNGFTPEIETQHYLDIYSALL